MLVVADFTPLRELVQEIFDSARVDINEELQFSTIARIPARLTARLADVLNELASKE